MTALETVLAGLFDYAGLYPPASLDMQTGVRNYLRYMEGAHRGALGRFVVHMDRIGELRATAGHSFPEMKLSVLVPADADVSGLADLLGNRNHVVIECKVSQPSDVELITGRIGAGPECYFEIPMGIDEGLLDAIKACGARVKLRMGGVVAEAFPSTKATALMLKALADRRLAFKATAGLHHPIRSRHALTYEPGSAFGTMQGFMNLVMAATLLHFDGTAGEALHALEEENPDAWKVGPDGIGCRAFLWSVDQLRAVRQEFFISIGTCSFEEPIHDLESLGWL